jgi:hypothetical protein
VYMSQSDYINKKKITLQLQKQTELSPILDSSFYTISKGHSISKDVSNSLITPSQLSKPQNTNNCAKFVVCSNTNNRPNRVIHDLPLYSCVKKYVKHKKNVGCDKVLCPTI